MSKMTPEYAEVLAKKSGCVVHHEFSRGVEWLVMSGAKGVEHVATWRIFQMTEAEFRAWHLGRAA